MERNRHFQSSREKRKKAGKAALALLVPTLLISAACVEGDGIVIQPVGPTDNPSQAQNFAPKPDSTYQQLNESTKPFDPQKAYDNYLKTQIWMMNSYDSEVSTTPSAISPFVWASDEKDQKRYAEAKIIPINQNGEPALMIVLNMRKFDHEMSGQDIEDAAIDLYQARWVFFHAHNPDKLNKDSHFLQKLQQAGTRVLPPSLKQRA